MVHFLHSLLIAPLGRWLLSSLSAGEEGTKVFIREFFAIISTQVNNSSAFFSLILFGRRPSTRKSERDARSKAWRDWQSLDSRGTLNAVLEQELEAAAVREGEPSSSRNTTSVIPSLDRKGALRNEGEYSVKHRKKQQHAPNGTHPKQQQQQQQQQHLFETPSGFAIYEAYQNNGLLENTRIGLEILFTRLFTFLRRILSIIFFLNRDASHPSSTSSSSSQQHHHHQWQSSHVWTASDAILRAGYPLEEHSVTTSDGYLLQIHRLPRRGSTNVVLFQHGVLDTSLGWVSNGSTGSLAFGAHDVGYDVWLGNSRANPPRLHVDPKKRSGTGLFNKYFSYSVNELAREDIRAIVEHIHKVKLGELQYIPGSSVGISFKSGGGEGGERQGKRVARAEPQYATTTTTAAESPRHSLDDASQVDTKHHLPSPSLYDDASSSSSSSPPEPSVGLRRSKSESLTTVSDYNLVAVGHSLGGASLLMYAVSQKLAAKPHRLKKLILMSPAGFHSHVPRALKPFQYIMPPMSRLLRWATGGRSIGLRLFGSMLRYVIFGLAGDLRNMPALEDAIKVFIRWGTSGDQSEWDRALLLPHFSSASMPALSLQCVEHFAQWAGRDGRFAMFDYRNKKVNQKMYGGLSVPPSMAENYGLLKDMSVDLTCGQYDGIIASRDVERHFHLLKEAGVKVSFRTFALGHLAVTFGYNDDVRHTVLKLLSRMVSSGGGSRGEADGDGGGGSRGGR